MGPRPSKWVNEDWQQIHLPIFRAGGALVIGRFCYAACLYVLTRARINYEFMLDFDPRTNTSPVHAASVAMRFCIFYLLSALLFTKALLGEPPPCTPHRVAPPSLPASLPTPSPGHAHFNERSLHVHSPPFTFTASAHADIPCPSLLTVQRP